MIRCLEICSFFLEWVYVFVFFRMIHAFLPLRRRFPLRLAAFFVCSILATMVIYSNDLPNLLGTLLGMIVYISIFHQGHRTKKITSVLVFYPSLIAVNYLMHDIGSRCFFLVTGASPESSGWTRELFCLSTAFYTLSLLLRLLFWLFAWQILKKYLQQITSDLTVNMWLMVDVLMLAPFIAIFIIIYFMPENPLIVYPICGASIFSGFGCLYLSSYICTSVRTAYHAQELEMKQAYYRERLDDEERVQSICHDMKNHLLVLERSDPPANTSQMVEKLQRELELYEDYVHTGNEILDIILKEKSRLAREKHLEFSVAADLNGMDFIEPLDISTIFGNSLDNAIEASEKLPKGQGAILMKAGRVQNFFFVLLENSCIKKDRAASTAKQDRFLHGFGISNMQKATEKYGGELITRYENGRFTLKILIPIP